MTDNLFPQPRFPEGTPEYDAYVRELKVELAKFAKGEDPYPYQQLINDPRSNTKIDVTGWELDRLAQTLDSLYYAIVAGSDRQLTDEEWDAVTGEPYGLPVGDGPRHADESDVIAATYRLIEIVNEAIFQRDLPRALEHKAQGAPLTPHEWLAYDRYVRELAEKPE